MSRPPIEDYVIESSLVWGDIQIGSLNKENLREMCDYVMSVELALYVLSEEMQIAPKNVRLMCERYLKERNITPEDVEERCKSYLQEKMLGSMAC